MNVSSPSKPIIPRYLIDPQASTGIYNGLPVEIGARYVDSGDNIVVNIYSIGYLFPNGGMWAETLLEYIKDVEVGECYCNENPISYNLCDNCELRIELASLADEPIPY
jgi:hypothetical protein